MLFASFGFSDYNLVFAALHMFLWGEVSKTFNTFSAVYKYNKLGNTFLYCIFFHFLSSPLTPPPPFKNKPAACHSVIMQKQTFQYVQGKCTTQCFLSIIILSKFQDTFCVYCTYDVIFHMLVNIASRIMIIWSDIRPIC